MAIGSFVLHRTVYSNEFGNIPIYSGIIQNISKHSKLFQNIPKYSKTFQNIHEKLKKVEKGDNNNNNTIPGTRDDFSSSKNG